MKQEIKEKIEELEKMKNSLNVEIRKIFFADLSEMMQKCEKIENISFTCYTPYFNDGDECVYSVNTDIIINDDDYYIIPYRDKDLDRKDKIEKYGEQTVIMDEVRTEIQEFLNEIPTDFYRSVFGDHVEVKVYKDGSFLISKYDHD